MNLLLALGSDSGAADQHLAALPADFERIAQVRAQLVQRGNDLQFFGERRGCGAFPRERSRGPGGMPGWRGMPPVVPATVLAGFVCWSTNSVISTQSRLRNSKRPSTAPDRCMRSLSVALSEFAILRSGLDVVRIRLRTRPHPGNAASCIAPGGVRSGAQRIVPIVVGGVEQAGDFGFSRGAACRPCRRRASSGRCVW